MSISLPVVSVPLVQSPGQMRNDTHCPVLQTLAGSLAHTLHCLRSCLCVNLLVWNLSREKKSYIKYMRGNETFETQNTVTDIHSFVCTSITPIQGGAKNRSTYTRTHFDMVCVCVCALVVVCFVQIAHLFGSVYYLCGMYACLCVIFFTLFVFVLFVVVFSAFAHLLSKSQRSKGMTKCVCLIFELKMYIIHASRGLKQ